MTNFTAGSHLLLEHRGKSYPVEFVSFAGVKDQGDACKVVQEKSKEEDAKKGRGKPEKREKVKPQLKETTNLAKRDMLIRAKTATLTEDVSIYIVCLHYYLCAFTSPCTYVVTDPNTATG